MHDIREHSVMTIRATRTVLLWCAILNYGLLLVWFWLYVLMHDQLQKLWGRWFHLSPEQFDFLNFAGMTLFKILILVFNLIPFIALLLVERANKERS